MKFKYLKRVNDTCFVLDHRLTPEVRAMLSAMSSRMPKGGIEARYGEVVDAIYNEVFEKRFPKGTPLPSAETLAPHKKDIWEWAEERLTTYPLHPKVQEFFDKFVKQYGHGSIKELTGSPTVFVEGVSPFTAYLSFDNPLVAGQEFSTRAVRHREWPMCREAYVPAELAAVYRVWTNEDGSGPGLKPGLEIDRENTTPAPNHVVPHPELEALHVAWLEVFEAEVEAWKVELRKPCETCNGAARMTDYIHGEELVCEKCEGTGKKYPFIKDPQAFRPALDRARWAIPGTIATGFSHTANVRTMGRVIADGTAFSATVTEFSPEEECPNCRNGTLEDGGDNVVCRGECGLVFPKKVRHPNSSVWRDIKKTYEEALPGMKGMWMREAVAGEEHPLPGHLKIGFVEPGAEVFIKAGLPPAIYDAELLDKSKKAYKRKPGNYLDPMWNQLVQIHIEFQCSLAVARDWHRHRTAYPWHLNIVSKSQEVLQIHPSYRALVEGATETELLLKSGQLFKKFRDAGDMEKAMLCLPLGTLVSMRTTMGLRDAVYMLELRANAHGANFEYEAQAKEALEQLRQQLGGELCSVIFPENEAPIPT